MIRVLLKVIFEEISGLNEEILIYLLGSCVFFIIFKFVSSSTIYNNYYFFKIAPLDQKFYILNVYVPENNVSRTLAIFFFYQMIYIFTNNLNINKI